MSTSVDSGGFTVSSTLNEAGVVYTSFVGGRRKRRFAGTVRRIYKCRRRGCVCRLAPKWLLLKVADGVSDWRIVDAVRGDEIALSANTANGESSEAGVVLGGDGFAAGPFGVGKKIIYIAIRS